ncbi:hypothetical protein K501DRAFT_319415 [Backusella circina FSU 941]|nr:hypothetical protein K501DRAFT_319415 [Backusella circina FSU 941]
MRRRRGGASSRDDEFKRNNSRYSRENSPLERQLFDPRSDNPIQFNRAPPPSSSQVRSIREDSDVRQQTDDTNSKRQTRTLWTGDDEKVSKTPPRIMERKTKTNNNRIVTVTKKTETKPAPVTEDELNKRKLKTLISSIHSIETSISKVTEASRQSTCFAPQQPKETSRYQEKEQKETIITDQDILEAEKIWREKMSLHLLLGSKYLEVLKLDPEYAEKKGLESLCWKRAIYSLVGQFRNALKNASTLLQETKKKKKLPIFNNELDDLELTPIISDEEEEGPGLEMKAKLAKMTLSLFLEFLDSADDFYQQLSVFLKSIDAANDLEEMEIYLAQWRRTKAYKWFSCINLRGDIARYRWNYIPDKKDILACSWTKQDAFEVAWKRYFLGVWLMPAKGNLYFNLSLLLIPEDNKSNTQGYGFHKLYFCVRSLMVRRNGFLNAREGIITLFESNRCWLNKYLETPSKPLNKKGANINLKKAAVTTPNDISVAPALFIRLHGMLFTKIGLDEFAKTKRIFFETLFPKRLRRELNENSNNGSQPAVKSVYRLSNSSQFWLEIIVLCLSSIYTYDYSNSKLGKIISNNKTRLFSGIDEQQQQKEQDLLEDMKNNILFINGIDLTCQIAVEIFQAYLDTFDLKVPELPELPHITLELKENASFLFEKDANKEEQEAQPIEQESNHLSELIYIEVLLHWMVMNGVCIQTQEQPSSLWEDLIGDIDYDLVFKGNNRHTLSQERKSNISPAFWPLLLEFLTKLLLELPDNIKYEMINHHFLDNEDENEVKNEEDVSRSEWLFSKDIFTLVDSKPELPEEQQLRGLGWVDETHGRLLKLGFKQSSAEDKATATTDDNTLRRKLKILNYGFILVKNLENVLHYDAVHETFTVSKDLEEKLVLNHQKQSSAIAKNLAEQEEVLYGDIEMTDTISAMDDDVLLSNDTDYSVDDDEDDDIMTQLKKRREQLQSMIVINEKEQQAGYHRLPARVKERKARLDYLRQHILPGKTVLVLDTNCFIGHIDLVTKLVNSAKWSIVVPLVVITELDGLRSSTQTLGSAAQEAIELIESVLAKKQRQNHSLRVQTSHNNFMTDISIRSEQFIFGETDKNLDDLVLSACLWWISQSHDKNTVPVCLVTGDRNLSVKARARDVQVAPVSAIMQLTPK